MQLPFRTPCFKVKVIAGGQRAPVEKVCLVNISMSDSKNISPDTLFNEQCYSRRSKVTCLILEISHTHV